MKAAKTTAKNQAKSASPRQRLLETADRLFYQEGIRSVGIDKVIAEAGVAKMTLYTHFPSKDDLILAVLQYREARVGEFFTAAIARHAQNESSKIMAFFAALKDWMETPDFRGCAFINATVELANASHDGSEYCRNQKSRFKQMLDGFVHEALGKSEPELVNGLSLLVEGAIVTAQVEGTSRAAESARDMASLLIEIYQKNP